MDVGVPRQCYHSKKYEKIKFGGKKMKKELILKAKKAESPEALAAVAKANGMELNDEEARTYFAQLHPKAGELSDEELDNVVGGGCQANDGRLDLNKDQIGRAHV